MKFIVTSIGKSVVINSELVLEEKSIKNTLNV